MNKDVVFGADARKKLLVGVDKAVDATKVTLGEKGRLVLIRGFIKDPMDNLQKPYWKLTKDGVTVMRSMFFRDAHEDVGASMVRSACERTVFEAGDGTTATAILSQALMHNAFDAIENGANPVLLKKGMELAKDFIVTEIAKHSTKVKTINEKGEEIINHKLVEEVAMISANSDLEVGGIVAKAIKEVGADGMIAVEDSFDGKTILEKTEGALLSAGLCSNYFVTDKTRNRAVLENPYVLLYDRKIDLFKSLIPILDAVNKNNGSLLIVCKECTGEALSTLAENVIKGRIKVAVVQMHEIGTQARNVLGDIAEVTGGTYISDERKNQLEKVALNQLGRAEKIIVEKDKTIIIPIKMDIDIEKTANEYTPAEKDYVKHQEKYKQYLSELTLQITNLEGHDKKLVEERRAKLTGEVAVIRVGGNTPEEISEKKDRVEDALCSSRSCIKSGVVAGGGSLFLKLSHILLTKSNDLCNGNADTLHGINVVIMSLTSPFRQLLLNAGIQDEVVEIRVATSNINMGFNLSNNNVEDLYKSGVIDSSDVLRCTIENSVTTAGLFIMTESTVFQN